MLLKTSVLLASTFALSAIATPIPDGHNAGGLTAQTITSISPSTASCDGAEFPEECADATRAAMAINQSFKKYKIESKGEQAALLALMLFESGDFKFSKNHFPGTPGQGTRNMQLVNNNVLYASDLFGEAAANQAKAQGDNAVLALVNGNDEHSFGSAAWYLATQCKETVRQGLATGSAEGWKAYLTECVQTTANPERDPSWQAALKALNGGN